MAKNIDKLQSFSLSVYTHIHDVSAAVVTALSLVDWVRQASTKKVDKK